MDNLSYRITHTDIDVPTLVAYLTDAGIPVSRKTSPKKNNELITFSLPIGQYRCRWMFRCNVKDRTINCSGGVTKTFFAHNVWVFKKEALQLAAITDIVAADLVKIDGITLPTAKTFITIERVEVTRHHELPSPVTKAEAINSLSTMFVTMFANRHFRNGATHDEPGTTGLGMSKSSRVCRVYDPSSKFKEKPEHIPDSAWDALRAQCENHLRVELIFGKRELKSVGLDAVAAWDSADKIEQLIKKRYEDYCLSVRFNASDNGLLPADFQSTNPAYVEAARHFFTDGVKGKKIDSRNGTSNRFKQFMAAKGYCTDVAFSRHSHLVHGLDSILQSPLAAELPDELRTHRDLFTFWWLL